MYVTKVQNKMLARTKTLKNNLIADHNAFEIVGNNGMFLAQPSILKFAGFEAGKTHTLKVDILNVSPAP